MKTSMLKKFNGLCLALALAVLTIAQSGSAAEDQPMGSGYDPATGETITVTKNADGTREVVKTDANGKELSRETRGNEPVSKAKPNTDPIGGSSVNPENEIKTEVILNGDGTRTIIISKEGKELHRETIKRSKLLSDDGYQLQRSTPSPVVVVREPVYVERREVVVERAPRLSIALGFGFGSSHSPRSHCSKSPCAPSPSKKKCK